MTTKPTDLPVWADDSDSPPQPAAVISTPPPARVSQGWPAGFPIVEGYLNWLFNLTGQWLTWLQTAPVVFGTLEEAIPATASGDVVIVDETFANGSTGASAGDLLTTYATQGKASGDDVLCLGGDQYRLWYQKNGGQVYGVLRSAPATVDITITKSHAGSALRIVSDGYDLIICYGNYVECFSAVTGVSRWVYDHGATTRDACIASIYVAFTGSRGTGNKTTRLLNRTTGSVAYSYDHNATTYSICWANGRYFIAGDASAYASAATLRALSPQLEDAAGEGGSADTNGLAWDVAQSAGDTVAHSGCLAADDHLLYVGLPDTASIQVESRGLMTGSRHDTLTLSNQQVRAIGLDHRWVVIAAQDTVTGRHYVHGASRGAMFRAWTYRAGTTTNAVAGMYADGARVWIGVAIAAGENGLYAISRGTVPSTAYRRMDYSAGDNHSRIPSALRRQLVALDQG